MAAADALVVYSGYEGLSHTILESLHLGAPVIASDKGGNPEVIRHGINGLVIPHVDLPALRQGISDLLQNHSHYAANTALGLERFRFETMVSQTDSLLRRHLNA